MCGIVGVVAKNKGGLFKGQVTMFAQMLFADQLRGTDGTGLFFDTKKGVKVSKLASDASTFINTKGFDTAADLAVKEGHFIIGHNRAATKGSLVWKNTHPFSEGGITLVHNGTLFQHRTLDDSVDVDSHAICKHMATNGHIETLKKVDGAFALVWHDKNLETLNLARNNQRPLNIVETLTSWIICSESGLGVWIAERNNQKVESVISLETGHVYTFNLEDLSKFTKTKVEYFVWKEASGGYNYGGDYFNKKPPHYHSPAPTHPQQKQTAVLLQLPNKTVEQTPPSRSWGQRMGFSPNKLHYAEPKDAHLSAIIYDKERGKNYILGKVDGEPLTDVRFYGNWRELTELAKFDWLEGTITVTRISKNKTIYTVENVTRVIKEVVDEEKEKYCSFCTVHVAPEQIKTFNGMELCSDCYETFETEPHLARECGYC